MSFKKILIAVVIAVSALAVFHGGTVHAALFDNSTSQACQGVGLGGNGCTGGASKIQNLITVALNILSTVVGVAAVIMIVIGGFKYTTSGGDSGKISSAKSTIVYALVGIVIVVLAQSIVFFVVKSANTTPKKTGIVRLVDY
ncbi:MAG TPA: hypothetical protein VJP80_07670 [Candidatus Saccharimonadales bacterium]|nr:hypothetical protein [Candidatus Saccharimonadales bacterium]